MNDTDNNQTAGPIPGPDSHPALNTPTQFGAVSGLFDLWPTAQEYFNVRGNRDVSEIVNIIAAHYAAAAPEGVEVHGDFVMVDADDPRSSKEIREAWNAALEEMDWTAVEDDVMAEHELEELDGEICAEIVEINRENVSFQDGDWRTAKTTFTDMVEITRGGVRVTEIEVTSSEDEEPYNEAVARIVGELPFTWVANSH